MFKEKQNYLRARYYSPALGRFLQEDVYRGDGLNLYAYCRNNPVMYYDPSGYMKRSTRKDRDTIQDANNYRMGDYGYNGILPTNSWKIVADGMGAHLYERKNVNTRNNMIIFDQNYTPTFYPYGGDNNAGQAHLRLHDETARTGMKVTGNPNLSDATMIKNFFIAYSTPHLQNIKGDLIAVNIKKKHALDVTPLEAFIKLNEWGMKNDPNFKNLMDSLTTQKLLNEDPTIQMRRKNIPELDQFLKNNSSAYDAYKKQMEEFIKKNGCGGN